MTNMTNWTQKFAGIDEHSPEHYPVILVEMNRAGRLAEKWQIGVYRDEETANKVRAKVAEMIKIGEDGPPLTEKDVEVVKQSLANLN